MSQTSAVLCAPPRFDGLGEEIRLAAAQLQKKGEDQLLPPFAHLSRTIRGKWRDIYPNLGLDLTEPQETLS